MKRGTKVKVTFTGYLVARPLKGVFGGISRVRPDGMPGWVAVVPTETVEVIEDET